MNNRSAASALRAVILGTMLLVTGPAVQGAMAASQSPPAASPSRETQSIELRGLFERPGAITLADLQTLPAETVETTYLSDAGVEEQHTYTGVRLWDALVQAGLVVDPDSPTDTLHRYIVLNARDGYVVVLSLGEIDPEFGGQPYLLAWLDGGEMLSAERSPVVLVTPGDRSEGRYIHGIVSIEVREVEETAVGS